MARMVIRVSGQRQKHGASLLGEIAKWLLRFSGDHHLTTPDTCTSILQTPPLLRQTAAVGRRHRRHCRCRCRRRGYQRHRAGGRRRRRCPRVAAAAAAAESSAAAFS